jgi:photosystem II stability/assembly factor-like uncharacterized protein
LDDLSFRAEFQRALNPVAPPAPWLSVAVRQRLRDRHLEHAPGRLGRGRVRAPSWLIPAVALVLAIAVVASLLLAAHELRRPPTVPIGPHRHAQAGIGCPAWGNNSYGGFTPPADTMTSESTGWSSGLLRTTDGGAHWHDVSPAAMRSDAPSGTDPKTYPPSYVDFFLGSDHAWLARSYSSPTSCFEHLTVFMTSDGGKTWRTSSPILAPITADRDLQLVLDFVDDQHGWLMVLAGGRLAPDWLLYSTTDGGAAWQLVAPLPNTSSFCGLTFISATTGFISDCYDISGPSANLTVTRDGGKTWAPVRLPEPQGSAFTVMAPVFFDTNRGAVRVISQTMQGNTDTYSSYVAVTSDGGRSWRAVSAVPSTVGFAFDFVDPKSFWALGNDGHGGATTMYRTANGGASWMLVNSGLPSIDFANVDFFDALHGFIIVTNQSPGQGPSSLLVTNDGGKTWKQINPQIQ